MKTRLSPTFLILAATLCGCKAVGPDYKRPEIASPASFATANGQLGLVATPVDAAKIARWWECFSSPQLKSLVERAMEGNRDLKIAAARVREAKALRRVSRSGLAPSVDIGASGRRSRNSERVEFGFGGERESTYFDIGADAAWELDLFGGVRRGMEASDADLAAAIEGGREVLVSLVAEVANAYIELRSYQERVAVVEGAIRNQRDTADLIKSRLDAGLSAELEYRQALAQVSLRESRLPSLKAGERCAIHRLGVLVGGFPDALVSELSAADAQTSVEAGIPVGAPSELLLRRPDLRRAERELAAATARIGVETANLYPRLTLNGSFAFEAADPGRVFDMNSRAWSIGPAVRWNLFDGGRTRARIMAADERAQAALIVFEQSFALAIEETENALVSYTQEDAKQRALMAAEESNTRAVELAQERYKSGVGGFIDVLDSQRTLYDTQEELSAGKANALLAYVAIYRSLGGGWSESELSATPSK